MRLRLDLAYDGTDFHGWARQPSLRTVQGELEAALDTVLRTTGSALTVAGRTDAGVHARGQVAHLELAPQVVGSWQADPQELERVRRRLNGVLPPDVVVQQLRLVPATFDARFSALWRRYRYLVADPATRVDPRQRHYVLQWRHRLDVTLMNAAAAKLLGEHDFVAFCKQRDGATTIRTIVALECSRDATGVVACDITADAFCHHLVRSVTGALLTVGSGNRPVDWIDELLASQTRASAIPVVAAHGLVMEQVAYPPDEQLGAQAERARTVRTLSSPSTPQAPELHPTSGRDDRDPLAASSSGEDHRR